MLPQLPQAGRGWVLSPQHRGTSTTTPCNPTNGAHLLLKLTLACLFSPGTRAIHPGVRAVPSVVTSAPTGQWAALLGHTCAPLPRWAQGFGCSPIKVVRELGSERRETVRSLSIVGVGNLRSAVLSTRGPGWTNLWCTSCSAKSTAG